MNKADYPIDRISYQLGMINGFAEMVACGVKRLALSPPIRPEDYPTIGPMSDEITTRFGIRSALDKSLLITHLQPEEFTRGKWSILYFEDEAVYQAYRSLKARKASLDESDASKPEALREISREFMRLLSYPENRIEARVAAGGAKSPFMLT